ncbi:hypothetical protein AGLY_003302 [Aphis glycines]|uniref:Uncharacterized protein n=1 Tax=Aphis glycines TaxID=307491 RepID=A0A6G0U002_APHGL|nr:hypothetical protein AGLY_003302 [Aphis glycines]
MKSLVMLLTKCSLMESKKYILNEVMNAYSIICRNNSTISNFGVVFRWKSEYPWCIIEIKSKHFPTVLKKLRKKKVTEKREFLRKASKYRLNYRSLNNGSKPQNLTTANHRKIIIRYIKKTSRNVLSDPSFLFGHVLMSSKKPSSTFSIARNGNSKNDFNQMPNSSPSIKYEVLKILCSYI